MIVLYSIDKIMGKLNGWPVRPFAEVRQGGAERAAGSVAGCSSCAGPPINPLACPGRLGFPAAVPAIALLVVVHKSVGLVAHRCEGGGPRQQKRPRGRSGAVPPSRRARGRQSLLKPSTSSTTSGRTSNDCGTSSCERKAGAAIGIECRWLDGPLQAPDRSA